VDVAVVHAAEEPTLIGVIKAPAQEGGSGGGQSQADLCGPGPISAQPAGPPESDLIAVAATASTR